jgi:propanol-preferring alcohol dehydrogenase
MSKMMKAAFLYNIGEELNINQTKIPSVGSTDVLIDIKASGICHSDLNYRDGISSVGKIPIILGHEIAGVIAKVGNKVDCVKIGDGVCVHYVVSCGDCFFCNIGQENLCEKKYQMIGKDLDGGFAEYVKVPSRNILKLPENIPFEQGALLGCSVSTAFHGLRRGKVNLGDTIVVIGTGGVGIHAVQLADKIFGAGKIFAMDLKDEKLKIAEKVGANFIINPLKENPIEKIEEITKKRFANVVLDCVGSKKSIETGLSCVGKGGRMVIIGIGHEDIQVSPLKTIIGKEIEIIGVNDHLKSEMIQLINFVNSGKIDLTNSVTHKCSLDKINSGFELLNRNLEDQIRIVVI